MDGKRGRRNDTEKEEVASIGHSRLTHCCFFSLPSFRCIEELPKIKERFNVAADSKRWLDMDGELRGWRTVD